MIIKNVLVYTPEQIFVKGAVRTEGEKITAVLTETAPEPLLEEEVIDGNGGYLLPGMIDLHFHGAKGADVCDGTPEAIQTAAAYEAQIGVTTICPATMTIPVPELLTALENAAAFHRAQQNGEYADCAHFAGLNMEGPFISPAKRGAQDPKNILPRSISLFHEFRSAADDLVRIVGVAPEEEGITTLEEFISEVKNAGRTHVSLAHTNAGYDDAKRAIDAGADHVVHLFNAMPAFGHREPGVIGAAAEREQVTAELICDGIHIHPSAVRAAFSMFGPERIILISDTMRAAGMPDGQYTLGGLSVAVNGRRATLTEGGALAGSVTPLPDCVREVVSMGIPLEAAVACATIGPARKLGIDDVCGTIETGKRADLMIWDSKLQLKQVILRGRPL